MCARRYDLTPTVISTLAFSALADQSEVDEQQGLMFLLAGAVLAFRNPRAHHAARTRPRKGRANLKRAEPWGGPNTVVASLLSDVEVGIVGLCQPFKVLEWWQGGPRLGDGLVRRRAGARR